MRNKATIILCPISQNPATLPGHLLFGSNHFESVGKESFGENTKVRYMRYKQPNNRALTVIWLNITLAARILTKRHNSVYSRTDPTNLILLSLLHSLGLYRKPIISWKYIAISRTGNRFTDSIKKLMYRGFYRIFMVTQRHKTESIPLPNIVYMRWGEDLSYVDSLRTDKTPDFTFISTGKAFRDMKTLCEAFAQVDGARLKIFTLRRHGSINYAEYLDTVKNKSIEVIYMDEMNDKETGTSALDLLFTEIHKANCSLSICLPQNFGVGYTQVIDSLACGVPVIATWNKDNPIDLDKEQVGMTVRAGDVEGLASAMKNMVSQPQYCRRMGQNGRKLIEKDYNITKVAHQVLNIIFSYKK